MSAARNHAEIYRTAKHSVRLLRRELPYALELQRRGRTIREIAESLEVPMKAVEQSLYWDVVQS